jgi:hypothetical protein
VSIYRDFVRFHAYLSPQTHYYPTACQVRALGALRLDPDRIAVVVGGNSILYGLGQSEAQVWTRHLQALLGERYQVINFGMCGAYPGEFGAIAAEMLQRDHPKLLFVTACGSTTYPAVPDGDAYRYFYWDAHYKGLIPHDARRDARLAAEARKRAQAGQAFAELQRGTRLDAALRFQDLWTAVAHQGVCTVWTPQTAGHLTTARREYVEADVPQRPLEQRYSPGAEEKARQTLGAWVRYGPDLVRGAAQDCVLIHQLHDCFPEAARRRTLMLLVRDNPYHVAQLASAERAVYDSIFTALAGILEAAGMSALDVGADYSEWDYIDCVHFSEQGGQHLAADVAPKLRAMARRLGYLK